MVCHWQSTECERAFGLLASFRRVLDLLVRTAFCGVVSVFIAWSVRRMRRSQHGFGTQSSGTGISCVRVTGTFCTWSVHRDFLYGSFFSSTAASRYSFISVTIY